MKSARSKTRDIEKKFADTAFRLGQERNDFFLPQIIDFIQKEKWLNLRPEYQRRLVWDDLKRSLFIESLLLNVPIPPLFLYEWELGRYEVMDGQQRLNAIVEFYQNGFALKGLEKWEELNGFRYKELPETLRRGLDRRRISATVLLLESVANEPPQRSDIRKLVFERLNTGGQHLNAQELRDCLYAGPFNQLLIELARERVFAEVWEIPPYEDHVDKHGNVTEALRTDRLYRRMLDCEIVLRFFAFRQRANIKGSVRSMLDRCMEGLVGASAESVTALGDEFRDRLKIAREVFGAHLFRHRDEKGKWRLSQPLYDGVMVAIDRVWEKRELLVKNRAKVVKSLSRLLDDEAAYEVIVGRPNTAKAVARRVDLIVKAMERAVRR